MVTDLRLTELVNAFGRDHAQAVWDAGLAAIAQIDAIVREHDIDCDFDWVDGYLHAPDGDASGERDRRIVPGRSRARDALGLRRDVRRRRAVRRRPRRPLRRSGAIPSAQVSGGTRARRDRDAAAGSSSTATPRSSRDAAARRQGERPHGDVPATSSSPRTTRWSASRGMASATLFQTKLALYTSYVVAGRVPRGTVPDALFWDTADPYHYLGSSRHRDHDIVIFGGEDHKTGQAPDTNACYERLERRDRVDDVRRSS